MIQTNGLAELPLTLIQQSKFNPRHFFDEIKINDMAQSIKKDGVFQPILVRPLINSYEIVAGERRWRASQIAGLDLMPCKIEEMDDITAIRRATKENLEREDLSAIEEAYSAQTALTIVEGDRKAAATILSWSESKLNKRLLLLNLSEKAQDALMKKGINLGHAELIASLTHDNQDNAVDSIIEKNVSVSELKERLTQFSYKLETAIFNIANCNGCPHNTSSQFTLFDESIGDGCCTNPECWHEKESSNFAYIKKSKEEDYNVVYLDIERTSNSYNYLIESKMGAEQFSQCQQCGKCGALISTRRETIGTTEEEVCFDTDCYKEKTAPKEVKSVTTAATTIKSTNAVAKKASTKAAKKSVDNKPPKKVLEFRSRLFKTVVSKELNTDRHMMNVMNTCILLESLPSQHSGVDLMKATQSLFKLPFVIKTHSVHDRYKTILKLYALSDDELTEIIAFCTCANTASGENHFDQSQLDESIEVIVKTLKPDLANHFVMDKAFLECSQKSGVIGLLKESGFSQWFDKKDAKGNSFTKLCKGTVKALLEAFTMSDFPLTGFVPKSLQYKGFAKTDTTTNSEK